MLHECSYMHGCVHAVYVLYTCVRVHVSVRVNVYVDVYECVCVCMRVRMCVRVWKGPPPSQHDIYGCSVFELNLARGRIRKMQL